ncbi:hypothetical protein BJ165DRAFT_1524795 [Panaeolus papilionaceus]|nr:hypothetical protein BJ165DRAFT_1524791 [Panaeolus papilionaceus]KAF9051899.1 hypothetical protein BJ165DRAFT_1524795 [Panaeolus papilionaceus]
MNADSFIPTEETPTEHPMYNEDAVGVVIQIDRTLYWANKADLIRYCAFFEGAFGMTEYVSTEGTVEKPLQFNDRITSEMFEPFLTWLWEGSRGDYTASDLENMLLLTNAWNAPVAQEFCLERLISMNTCPFYRIRVVMPYKDPEDLRRTIITAIGTPQSSWPMNNRPVDTVLMQLKIRLQEVRRDLVAQPPAITRNPNCSTDDHVVCHGWWQDDWRRYVSEPVFRTINPMPISRAYEAMKAITFHTSVCRKDAMEALMANELLLTSEDRLIDEAVRAVSEHLSRQMLI